MRVVLSKGEVRLLKEMDIDVRRTVEKLSKELKEMFEEIRKDAHANTTK